MQAAGAASTVRTAQGRRLNTLVLLVEKPGEKAKPAAADTVFAPGDKLTVFGDYRVIRTVFEAREQFDDQ